MNIVIILFIITLFLSAFFSGTETAFISANKFKLTVLARRKQNSHPGSFLLIDPERFLISTLVGNNIVMVACSSLAVLVFRPLIPDSLLIMATTVALLVFGEILPKTFAQQIPNRVIKLLSILLSLFYYLFYPFIFLAQNFSQLILSLIGGDKSAVHNFFRKDDLPMLIRKYSSPGKIRVFQRKLIAKAIRIGKKRLIDVMIPRTDIVGAKEDVSVDELLQLFNTTRFSRLPIYRESLDNILGFIYLFDLLNSYPAFNKMIRKAIFLPESISAIHALRKLRENNKSVAIVIDEHGGTAGLVTMEDIVEELFGSIFDEYDSHLELAESADERTIIASGRAEIDDLEEQYRLKLPKGDYVTLGGFIQDRLGYIPRPNEQISLPNCLITVLKSDDRRILKVNIKMKR